MTLPLLLIQLAQHPASGQLSQLKQAAQLKQAIQQSTQPRQTSPLKRAIKKAPHLLAPIPGAPERLLIRSDDEALGRAIVRSANQHVVGSVELLPRGVSPPPRALRLVVRLETMDRLMLVLSRGSKLSVVRLLKISGRPGLFDLAETVALASAEMRARLDEQVRRSLPGPAREVAGVSLPPSIPEPGPEEVEPPPPELSSIAPPVTELKVPDQSPETLESTAKEPEPVTPPSRFTAPLPLKLPTEPSLPSAWPPGWRWRTGLGTSLAAGGLLLGGLGIASLVLDGRCADEAVPCEYRFDGRTAGTVELAVGGAALLAGLGLIGSVLHQHRLLQNRAVLVPKISSRGVGITLSLEF